MNVLSLFDGMSCGRLALHEANVNVDRYYSSEIKPKAIEIANKHFPQDIPHRLGDITKIDGTQLGKIDLLIGGSPCFVAGTKVITRKGYVNIEDITVGMEVMTHTNTFQKVLNTGGKVADTITVEAQGIKPTVTTPEHPYYVREMHRKWDSKIKRKVRVFSDPIWKEAGKLSKGDFIGIPINKECSNPLELTKEECYILGRYIADGHTRKDFRTSEGRPTNRQWQLILSVGESKVEHFKSKIQSNHFSCYKHTDGVYRIVFSNKRLVQIAEEYCGVNAKNKVIPQVFLDLPIDLLESVLDGYMSGDGSSRCDVYKASSISELLVLSLSQAVAKVYRTNSSYEYQERPKTHVIEGRVVNQSSNYSITFRKVMKKQSNAVVLGDIIWVPFKRSTVSGTELVFNLEVANDNSYTANNVIVHNCQNLSAAHSIREGLVGDKSRLFYEYYRLLQETKPTYFLLENVRMKKSEEDIITELLGVEPIAINSAVVSPQLRQRLYWTNIPQTHDIVDKGIRLNDILVQGFSDREKARCLLESDSRPLSTPIKMAHRYFNTGFTTLIFKDAQQYRDIKEHFYTYFKGKSAKEVEELSANMYLSFYDGLRYMTKEERALCQTIHPSYVEDLTDNEAAGLLGDGWTVDVIAHLLKPLASLSKS